MLLQGLRHSYSSPLLCLMLAQSVFGDPLRVHRRLKDLGEFFSVVARLEIHLLCYC
jgi:hypothetical protein